MKQQDKTTIYNFPAKWYGNKVLDATIHYNDLYKFEMTTGKNATHNNEADAFKHAYMQAQLTLWFGKHISKVLGDFHEWQGNKNMGQPAKEYNMDNWNNQQGREIAKEILNEYGVMATIPSQKINDIISQKVINRMHKGQLITDPNDKRKYIEGQPTGFATDVEHIFTREEIAEMALEDYQKNEKAIMRQLKERGIPKEKDLVKTKHKNYSNKDGRWVTIDGNHVFIEK